MFVPKRDWLILTARLKSFVAIPTTSAPASAPRVTEPGWDDDEITQVWAQRTARK